MFKQNNPFKNMFLAATLLTTVVACTKNELAPSLSTTNSLASRSTGSTTESKTVFGEIFSKIVEIPTPLALSNAYHISVELIGKGYQVYKVQLKAGTTDQYEWAFVAPEADLYNMSGIKVGEHAAGPIWRDNAGNTIGAVKEAGVNAPNALNDIPWLKLKVNQYTLKGMFTGVKYIHRIKTVGGVAPSAATATAANVGEIKKVPYLAEYVFYTN